MRLTQDVLATLPKGKAEKRGREQRYACPRCRDWNPNPAGRDLGVDQVTGEFHCWYCHWSGIINGFVAREGAVLPSHEYPDPDQPLAEVPEEGLDWLLRRGLDARGTVRRFLIRWDGRLCWPCGEGWARRSIRDDFVPKVQIDCHPSQGALLGVHRLHPGAVVVLTEGDCKAASIPLPWIGVATLGCRIHEMQAQRIILSNPKAVVLMYDGGVKVDVPPDFQLAGVPVFGTEGLPAGRGPDDVEAVVRVGMLLKARRLS